VLSVIVRQPGLSSADLARAISVTPQAANLLVNGLDQQGLIERRPHASHGRILEIHPTDEGRRRVRAAYPAVKRLEESMTEGMSPRQVQTIKRWLVDVAARMASTIDRR
jgi:DNA-binding MarR family transcriptional regulator